MTSRGDATAGELRKIKAIDGVILAAIVACGGIALSMNNQLIQLNTLVATQAVEIKDLKQQIDGFNTLATRVTALEVRVTTNERRIEQGAH